MITLKIIKAILPVCGVKNSNRLNENENWNVCFLKKKITNVFKNCQVIRPKSPPLIKGKH